MEWKWSKGEPYERSRRYIHKDKTHETDTNDSKESSPQLDASIQQNQHMDAYTSSLNYDENTWDILNQHIAQNGFKISNKREELDTKIADRQLIQQRGFNPFLTENSYVEDVSIRDQYLKPTNTTSSVHNE